MSFKINRTENDNILEQSTQKGVVKPDSNLSAKELVEKYKGSVPADALSEWKGSLADLSNEIIEYNNKRNKSSTMLKALQKKTELIKEKDIVIKNEEMIALEETQKELEDKYTNALEQAAKLSGLAKATKLKEAHNTALKLFQIREKIRALQEIEKVKSSDDKKMYGSS